MTGVSSSGSPYLPKAEPVAPGPLIGKYALGSLSLTLPRVALRFISSAVLAH